MLEAEGLRLWHHLEHAFSWHIPCVGQRGRMFNVITVFEAVQGPAAQIPKSQEAVGGNHAVSGLKFRILRRFLVLGYAVRCCSSQLWP